MASYTNLHTFWQCPRRYALEQMGYHPIIIPEPLKTGQLVHLAIASHFSGRKWLQDMATEIAEQQLLAEKMANYDIQLVLKISLKRAVELTSRYIYMHGEDYSRCICERKIQKGEVIAHPDLVATYDECRVVVDFKTSYHPDIRWYNISGQLDLYAYMLKAQEEDVDFIVYDVISEDGIYRHQRPPNYARGETLFVEIAELADKPTLPMLDHPHLIWNCPSRCDFFVPCYLMETAGWETAEDYMSRNFLNERSGDYERD